MPLGYSLAWEELSRASELEAYLTAWSNHFVHGLPPCAHSAYQVVPLRAATTMALDSAASAASSEEECAAAQERMVEQLDRMLTEVTAVMTVTVMTLVQRRSCSWKRVLRHCHSHGG